MLYLVSAEPIDTEPPPPEEMLEYFEQMVIGSLEMFKQLEDDGALVAGGLQAGYRDGAFLFEAGSHDELHEMLVELPIWPMLRLEITPLQSIDTRLKAERDRLDTLKERLAS